MSEENDPVRFGAEFGPYRSQHQKGVSLSTFKTLVWVSNIGGLLLVVIAFEMMIVQQRFYWGIATLLAGVLVALFPSNYEIVGMKSEVDGGESSEDEEEDTE